MADVVKPVILLVEDDKAVSTVLSYNLRKNGYAVHIIESGEEAMNKILQCHPDLVILDWVLDGKSGIDVCREMRALKSTKNIPVIMLTAKNHDMDKVAGFDAGADDYISKPFSPLELISRIKSVFRRIRPAFSESVLRFYDVEMRLESCAVVRNGKEIKLAPIEFQILQIMMERPGTVLNRNELIQKVWEGRTEVNYRTVDVHITRLRKALLTASSDDFDIIRTVRLAGYKLQMPKNVKQSESFGG